MNTHASTLYSPVPTDRAVPLREVEHLTGLKRSTIYARMKGGAFPKQRTIPGSNRVRWSEREVLLWLQRLLHSADVDTEFAA